MYVIIALTIVFALAGAGVIIWPLIRVEKHPRLPDNWDPMASRGRIRGRHNE